MTLMDAVHAPSMHTSTRSSASVSLDLLNQQSHLTFAPFDHVSLRAETCRERRLNTPLSSQSRHICFWTVLSHLSTDITGAACDTSACPIWHNNLFSVMTIFCLCFKIGCGLVDHTHHDLSSKYCMIVVLPCVYSIPRVCCLHMSTYTIRFCILCSDRCFVPAEGSELTSGTCHFSLTVYSTRLPQYLTWLCIKHNQPP